MPHEILQILLASASFYLLCPASDSTNKSRVFSHLFFTGESTESHGPYLEIGADESGRVTMEHFPPISYDQGFCQEPHMLVSLDVEAVLLRAAAANSAVIMGEHNVSYVGFLHRCCF